jgi:hypothetical protein
VTLQHISLSRGVHWDETYRHVRVKVTVTVSIPCDCLRVKVMVTVSIPCECLCLFRSESIQIRSVRFTSLPFHLPEQGFVPHPYLVHPPHKARMDTLIIQTRIFSGDPPVKSGMILNISVPLVRNHYIPSVPKRRRIFRIYREPQGVPTIPHV